MKIKIIATRPYVCRPMSRKQLIGCTYITAYASYCCSPQRTTPLLAAAHQQASYRTDSPPWHTALHACTHPQGELLLADAPETIERLLRQEQDLSTRRNCLAMLTNHATDRAIRYLFDSAEQLSNWGDLLQLSALDLIRKVGAECVKLG